MTSGKIALIVVGYNRPDSVRRILGSLDQAKYEGYHRIPLIISLDHSGNEEVAAIAKEFQWKSCEKRVICHSERLG